MHITIHLLKAWRILKPQEVTPHRRRSINYISMWCWLTALEARAVRTVPQEVAGGSRSAWQGSSGLHPLVGQETSE